MALKALKTGLKASTHVFTVGGVLVAASPLMRGLVAVADGDIKAAGSDIAYDTTGFDPANPSTRLDVKKAAGTAIAIGLGIGLVWGGAQLRKRIGN